ncbi:MAG TPA: hypothetical protein VFL70_01455, partial [Bacteroidia bacterium]|nr:hypothetical protein [Bacteroidia bacterium]
MKYVTVILLALLSFTLSFAQHKWVPVGASGNDEISIIAHDAASNVLYIGGAFSSIGGISANSIVKYNGANWTALGSGVTGDLKSIIVNGTKVYAGGYLTFAGGMPVSNIAVYDTISLTWSTLGAGTNSTIKCLAVYNNELYAGGLFTQADGNTVNYIAKWNGINWVDLAGGTDGEVDVLAVYNNELYVGGAF